MMISDPELLKLEKYAVDQIIHVCNEIGPRMPGSQEEARGHDYMKQELAKFVDEVQSESFNVHPKAFMGVFPLVAILTLASTALFWFIPWVGLILASVALLSIVLEFLLYKRFLDPFFPKKKSQNLSGIKNAGGETKRILLLGGHIDSTWEWRYNLLKSRFPLKFVILSSLAGLVLSLLANLSAVLFRSDGDISIQNIWGIIGIILLFCVPGGIASIFFTNFNKQSPGANDNLSGVFTSIALAKYIHEHNISFENTEIRFLQCGAEEPGLRGSKSYAKKHRKELRGIESMYIAMDTFRDLEFLTIYTRDMTKMVKNSKRAGKILQVAGKNLGRDLPFDGVPLGASDAAAFSQAGIDAVCLAAQDPKPLDYYHTRRDTPENLRPKTMGVAMQVILEAMKLFDAHGFDV
ncbi:MAG: M28 family metallopeptidase [Promethearchaeota archaeon]